MLCAFINPEAAKRLFKFDESSQASVEGADVPDDQFFEEIQQHSSEKLTPEELQDRIDYPERYEQLDTIEPV